VTRPCRAQVCLPGLACGFKTEGDALVLVPNTGGWRVPQGVRRARRALGGAIKWVV
jgi:hypothetical protein